jgi:hypothetical protein
MITTLKSPESQASNHETAATRLPNFSPPQNRQELLQPQQDKYSPRAFFHRAPRFLPEMVSYSAPPAKQRYAQHPASQYLTAIESRRFQPNEAELFTIKAKSPVRKPKAR